MEGRQGMDVGLGGVFDLSTDAVFNLQPAPKPPFVAQGFEGYFNLSIKTWSQLLTLRYFMIPIPIARLPYKPNSMDPNNPQAAAKAAWLSRFPHTQTTPLKSRVCLSLVVAIAFVGFAYTLLTSSSTELAMGIHPSQEGGCYRILLPASFLKTLPLPLPIDETAHQAVLNEIGWLEPDKQLLSLVNERSLVCSELLASVSFSQEFIKQLAYTCSESKYTKVAFENTTKPTHQQIELTLTGIDDLAARYAALKDAYCKINLSAAEALKKGQLSTVFVWLVRNQPQNFKRVGIDFYEWWWIPVKEHVRKNEEAKSGMTALSRESQRLEQIEMMFRELKRSLELLIGSVNQWDTGFGTDSIARQGWLQDWFQQHIYQSQKLEKLYLELFGSVDDREEPLVMKITPDWCKHQEF